jgi:flagellar biosynthesis protein FlhF
MKIKTFRARTMAEAMDMIKKEMGPDAVILKSGKVIDGSGEALFEVQAAIDHKQEEASPSFKNSTNQLKQIEDKIEEITHFLSLLVSTKEQLANFHNHEILSRIYHHLLMQELDEKKVYLLLTKAVKNLKDEKSPSKIIAAFCRELMNAISIVNPFSSDSITSSNFGRLGLPPVYTFLGPTGVGKTTTIAKLAAHLKITKGLNVGIVSFDSYRIGASEQIATYARVLELPFATVQTREELEFARKQMRNCFAVFVDTTGRNFLMSRYVLELVEVFSNMEDVRHFLVLSATAKDKDLTKTIQQFDSFGIYGLIFTKVDETLSCGNIINQLLRFSYPLAYLGTGQRVPEDLEEASKKRLINLLFPKKEGLV